MADELRERALGEQVDRWRKAQGSARTRKDSFRTSSGIAIEDIYTPETVRDLDYLQDLGLPGEPPFTRGVQPTMYRGRLWTMRQYAGFASAEETNTRFRYLLEQGQTGLSVAFDLPTQLGLDSDDPLASGEVGRVGVAIDSVEDLSALFDGIALDSVSTSMTINATAAILLVMYIAVAKEQGVSPAALKGTVQNDILKEYVARGTYIFPPHPSMRLVGDLIEYCSEHLPGFNTISVSGYHIREAGATAAQEIAFTLADAIAYVQAMCDRGLPVDSFAPRLAFFFNAHSGFMEEICKFRAARKLWYRIMKERFHATDPRALKLRFHTQTAGSTLTASQPLNNVVRVALQALSAVLGGTQSLHTNSWDEAIGLPTEESARTALRTQQIVAHETGVADVVDPLAGSYFVEALTLELCKEAMALMNRIDDAGGMLAAIESGLIQSEIEQSAYETQRAMESGEQTVVGVNRFCVDEAGHKEALKVDPLLEEQAKARLARLRASRDNRNVQACLQAVEDAAAAGENLIPVLMQAVEGRATIGEITAAMKKHFGEHNP